MSCLAASASARVSFVCASSRAVWKPSTSALRVPSAACACAEGGLGLAQLGVVRRRVESRDDLSGVHERVEVGGERLDDPGDLRADLDRRHCLQRTRSPPRGA